MRERRKAEDEAQDAEEWEVWKPPPQTYGGLIGSHCFSGPSPVSSQKVPKSHGGGVRARWTQDDVDEQE